jgi:hypothetical protein
VGLDFSDRRERDLNNLAVGAKHFDARSRESLSSFHAPNSTPYSPTVGGDDLDIVFAIKGLQGRQSFSDFHSFSLSQVRSLLLDSGIRRDIALLEPRCPLDRLSVFGFGLVFELFDHSQRPKNQRAKT